MERTFYTQDEYEKANSTPIHALALSLGLTCNPVGHHRLRVNEMDSIEIDTLKNCFYRHSQQRGGGAVQFMKMVKGIDTVKAVHALNGTEYENYTPPLSESKKLPAEKQVPFSLPERAPHHRHVFAYLHKDRKIDKDILSEMMHQKRLFETVFKRNGREYYNCVFVGLNSKNEAVHAATRFARKSDAKAWRVVAGSDCNFPFSMEGSGSCLQVYESSIDALSGATLDKLMGKNWKQDHRLSLGGLSQKPIDQYLKDYPVIKKIVFCIDNDIRSVENGEENHGQVAMQQMCETYRAQGYQVEKLIVSAKDVNQTLLEYISMMEKQKDIDVTEQEESEEWENEQ